VVEISQNDLRDALEYIQMALVTNIPDTSIYWLEAYLLLFHILNKHILITKIFL